MTDDPVLVRRARIATAVKVGKRLGYSLFLLAVVLFFVGLVIDLTPGLVSAIVASMLIGSIVLAPAIVFDYGVKAAVREDREAGRDPGL